MLKILLEISLQESKLIHTNNLDFIFIIVRIKTFWSIILIHFLKFFKLAVVCLEVKTLDEVGFET